MSEWTYSFKQTGYFLRIYLSYPGGFKVKSGSPKKKKKKIIKWIIIAIVIVVILVILISRGKKAADGLFTEDVAALRPLQTYHTFSGTIAPVNQKSVVSFISGSQIVDVPVSKGDTVKEGDIIAYLDTSAVDEQILEKETGMNISSYQSALNIQSARNAYENYKSDLENGLNQTLLSAQSGIDSAFSNLVSAQVAYNHEVNLNNRQLSTTIMSAMQSVNQAYTSVENTSASTKNANDEKAALLANNPNADTSVIDRTIAANEQAESTAWQNYNNAAQSYEAAKLNEENNLTRLFDQLITAQNSYLMAIDNYNAAVSSVNHQLETYELQLRLAQANADTSLSQLQLEDLKNNLDKYVITAPISGVITSLNVKEGDMSSVGTVATITDFNELKIDIKIGEYDVQGVSEGSDVTINVEALDKEYNGRIGYIDRVATVEGNVSYFIAEVWFDADEQVRSGMSAEARFIVNDIPSTLTVLNDSIQTASDGTSYVNIKDEKSGTMIQKPVTCGITDGTYTQILDGLSEGDKVYYMQTMMFGPYMQVEASD